LSPQLNSVLGSAPVVMNCSAHDEPSMYMAFSIPVYVTSHVGGGGWVRLSGAVEEDEAEGVGSPSVGKPMSVDSDGGRDEYRLSLSAPSHPATPSSGDHHWVCCAGTGVILIKSSLLSSPGHPNWKDRGCVACAPSRP